MKMEIITTFTELHINTDIYTCKKTLNWLTCIGAKFISVKH